MSDGWLEITGASHSVDLKVAIGDWEFFGQNIYDKEDLPSRNWITIDLLERNIFLDIKNAHATSYNDLVTGCQILDDDDNVTIRIRRNTSNYCKLYNGKTGLTVKPKAYNWKQEDYAGERFVFIKIRAEVVD